MLILGIIIGIIVLVLLVVAHEFGHAIVARRNGVVVEEFGIGFPPKAWGKKLKNGVLFTLNWLPLGGFVKLKGEHDADTKKGSFGAATFWQKTKILLAGVLVNWVIAVVLLSILAVVGLPKILPDQFSVQGDTTIRGSAVKVTELTKDYPAEKAGLKPGDAIISIDGKKTNSAQELIDIAKSHRAETVSVKYERAGAEKEVNVTLRDTDSGLFGAKLGQQQLIMATWSAPVVGVVTAGQFTWETLKGLGNLFVDFFGGLFGQLNPSEEGRKAATEQLDRASDSVAGPVGILGVIFPAASEAGLGQVVFLAAIISLTLAVMNTLPIPSLDGGRWFVMAWFKLFKKKLTKDREDTIHGIGFMVLMILIIAITVADVFKFF